MPGKGHEATIEVNIHREALDKVRQKYGYSWVKISEWSGIPSYKLSKFSKNTQDLLTGEYLAIAFTLPSSEARSELLGIVCGEAFTLQNLISQLPLGEVLRCVAKEYEEKKLLNLVA